MTRRKKGCCPFLVEFSYESNTATPNALATRVSWVYDNHENNVGSTLSTCLSV